MLDSTFTVFALRTFTVGFVLYVFFKLGSSGSSKRKQKASRRRSKHARDCRTKSLTREPNNTDVKTLIHQLNCARNLVQPRRALLDPTEMELLYVLWSLVENRYYIALKQNLSDVFTKVNGRVEPTLPSITLDFVLCDPETLAPVLVVMLSNPRADNKLSVELERAKEAFLQHSGLPFVCMPRAARYNEVVVERRIQMALGARSVRYDPALKYA